MLPVSKEGGGVELRHGARKRQPRKPRSTGDDHERPKATNYSGHRAQTMDQRTATAPLTSQDPGRHEVPIATDKNVRR
jgi:hypothetical protein